MMAREAAGENWIPCSPSAHFPSASLPLFSFAGYIKDFPASGLLHMLSSHDQNGPSCPLFSSPLGPCSGVFLRRASLTLSRDEGLFHQGFSG